MSEAKVSRRGMMGGLGLAALASAAPAETAELTVSMALEKRRSVRQYVARGGDMATRDRILWAAFGLNRPAAGGHAAPSWHGANDLLVHVADASGVGLFDPASNMVTSVLGEDIRPRLSPQPFVRTAPLCLIFVSDLDRLSAAVAEPLPPQDRALNAHVDAAVAAQNVYLICAALGLGTCLVGAVDRPAITAVLGLGPSRLFTYVQPVGWPA